MRIVRVRVSAATVAAFFGAMMVAVLAWSAAPAFAANSGCLGCHGVGGDASATVDFVVPGVVRASACIKCHWEPAGGHPYHNATWDCASCHSAWGFTNTAAIPSVSTTYGWFNTAAGAEAGADRLHVIHSNPSWVGSVTKNGRQCSSCHAAAACTACHTSPSVAVTHREHTWVATSAAYAPGAGPAETVYGRGTSVGNEQERTLATGLTCSNATCHATPTGADAPVVVEDAGAGISYSGTGWARVGLTGATANSYYRSNAAAAKATYAFTGQQVELISLKHPYFGKARVSVDGTAEAVVDLFSATTVKQALVYTSPLLASGAHTITVEVLRQKDVSARDYYVAIDAIRVYPKLRLEKASCAGCHNPMKTHGASHLASETYSGPVGVPAGAAGSVGIGSAVNLRCVSCHRRNILADHGTSYDNCDMCHATGGPASSFPSWDGTCRTGACHPVVDGNTSAPHPAPTRAMNHELVAPGYQPDGYCQSCHGNPEGWQCGAPFGCHANTTPPFTSVDYRAPSTVATRTGSDPIVWRLLATDIGDGVTATYYSFDGAPFALYTASDAASGVVNPEDDHAPYAHTLQCYSVDAAGNVETVQTTNYNVTDNTPPVVSFNGLWTGGSSAVATSIAMSVVDPKVKGLNTGVAYVFTEVKTYKTNWGWFPYQAFYQPMAGFSWALDGTWDTTRVISPVEAYAKAKSSPGFWPTYGGTIDDPAGGNAWFEIQYYARDYTGNQSPLTYVKLYVDNTAPVTTTSTVSAYRWRLNATDNIAGVGSTLYSIDGGPYVAYTAADVTNGVGGGASGAHTLRFYSVDLLGLTEAVKTQSYSVP